MDRGGVRHVVRLWWLDATWQSNCSLNRPLPLDLLPRTSASVVTLFPLRVLEPGEVWIREAFDEDGCKWDSVGMRKSGELSYAGCAVVRAPNESSSFKLVNN